jgi:DNA polymerase III delta prime subunit
LKGESKAKSILEAKLGHLSEEDIRALLAALNADYWNDKERKDRFMPAFYGHLANQIAGSPAAFNHWTEQLWQGSEDTIDALLDEFWKKNEIAGSGTSLPTAILYLRDPERYTIWIPAMEHGVKAVLPTLTLKKRRTAAGYRIFNDAAVTMRKQLGLTPQSMDVVLTLASKEAGKTQKDEFSTLFNEFVGSFVDSKEGEWHLGQYGPQRQEAQKNYQQICEMESRGESITDAVLLKLLPYADTASNRAAGSWVHVAPAINGNIKQWFEGIGWTKAEDWPEAAKTILDFVKRCLADAEALADHCKWFADTVPSKGFQMGMLSPILNALKPDVFCIINSKPRDTLNHFAGKAYDNSLQSYPDLNKVHFDFQAKYAELLEEVGQGTALPGDVLDMYCHWLVAVRKFSFTNAKVYKIAPGRGAEYWEECRDNGYILIGWDELGDLSDVSKEEFEKRRDHCLAQHDNWTKAGVGQVWRFSRIKEGDRIIANSGKTKILGFGTVIGPYYFVPNTHHGHRLPVLWDDVTPRKVNEPSWSGTLQKVSAERFEELRQAEVDGDGVGPDKIDDQLNPEYPIAQLVAETGFDEERIERWLSALDRKKQAVFYGPPGTGKTFLADKLAKHLIGGHDGFSQLVQFHPEYAYQDFMQGIRPVTGNDGQLSYKNTPGVFLDFCRKAEPCRGRCVLIIDEINRANLSRAFGELMYLLEYRSETVELAGGGKFSIPENVRIIGTMNTADRSIALVDYALRRRFAFMRLAPEYEVLKKSHADASFDVAGLVDVLKELNLSIGDPHYEVGISFFLVDNLEDEVEDIWRMEIEPYLEEFFFDNLPKAEQFGWENVKVKILG